ncbi:MAG: sulfite exporter TauE/SafE family protein, partial [Desulfovibrio sp.]|nr:sulfite exporter TauE/SafE family protein [Desulfovibrio sp.]
LVAAIIMLVGASVGAQVGSVATKYIKGYGIRIAFGVAVIACIISIVLKLIPDYISGTKAATDVMALWLVNGMVVALSAYITIKMVQGAKREIAAKKARG